MNLKEAFRYQNFLDNLFQTALIRLTVKACSLSTVKKHLTSAVIPEKADFDEVVEPLYEYSADNLILLIDWLITEKEKLTKAIWEAKNALGFNIDAAIEANKFRQAAYRDTKAMLASCVASTSKEKGAGYKFNGEGNQVPYYYDVEVVTSTRYDEKSASEFASRIIKEADEASARIDEAMVTTKVNYEPAFNVNLSFEEVVKSEQFSVTTTA